MLCFWLNKVYKLEIEAFIMGMVGKYVLDEPVGRDVSGLAPLTFEEAVALRSGHKVVALVTDKKRGITQGAEYNVGDILDFTKTSFGPSARSVCIYHTTDLHFVATYYSYSRNPRNGERVGKPFVRQDEEPRHWWSKSTDFAKAQ